MLLWKLIISLNSLQNRDDDGGDFNGKWRTGRGGRAEKGREGTEGPISFYALSAVQ